MLKEKVSGKRKRYKDHRFNLDLTYITDWVIAMSYPASGLFERTYRNSIKEVRTPNPRFQPSCTKSIRLILWFITWVGEPMNMKGLENE